MPYITKEDRKLIHDTIDMKGLCRFLRKIKKDSGSLASLRFMYHIIKHVVVKSHMEYATIDNGRKRISSDPEVFSYKTHNAIMGMFTCCRREWERRSGSLGWFEESYGPLSVAEKRMLLSSLKHTQLSIKASPNISGQLNYFITSLLFSIFPEQINRDTRDVRTIEYITCMLATLEENWYKEFVSPYEEIKMNENGDVIPII